MPSPRTFHLVSLGCPKNLVDSEGIAALLRQAGLVSAGSPAEADVLIVNTCGFIEPAREESRAALQVLAEAKRGEQVLIAAGCYAQRAPRELADAVPAIDGVIGTRSWDEIVPLVARLERERSSRQPWRATREPARCRLGGSVSETPTVATESTGLPRVAIQGASAYLKLADGCHRSCAFCAIPLIKGTAVSRPAEAIVSDAVGLAAQGVQEIILIAQDTTSYGRDLGMRDGLADLLDRLVAAVPEAPWIRVMYAYPGLGLDRLAETMARHAQILPYIDIPLQHAHPDVLRRMRRPPDADGMRRAVGDLRRVMPEIVIRTTFIVGYPGETEDEFATLLDFVAQVAFDRIGVFGYSHEEGTPAGELSDDVPPHVKEERRQRLMALQQPISLAKNEALVGQTLDVLVEGQGDGLSVGRSYRDAPEIDGLVLVQAELPVGRIVPIRITSALEYDLVGELPGSSQLPGS